jgi:hypothetical protein
MEDKHFMNTLKIINERNQVFAVFGTKEYGDGTIMFLIYNYEWEWVPAVDFRPFN